MADHDRNRQQDQENEDTTLQARERQAREQRNAPPKPSQAEGDRATIDESIREKEQEGKL